MQTADGNDQARAKVLKGTFLQYFAVRTSGASCARFPLKAAQFTMMEERSS